MKHPVFALSSELVDAFAAASPIRATFWGVAGHDDRWDDLSPLGDAERAAILREFADRAAALPPVESHDERLAHEVLLDFLALEQDALDHDDPAVDLNNLASPPQLLTMALDTQDTASDAGAAAAAARRAALPAALRGYQQNLLAGAERGQQVAARQVRRVIAQCEAMQPAAGGEVAAEVAAAYAAFGRWLAQTFLPRTTEVDGVGEARYRRAVRRFLGTDLDLRETYAWGWERVAALRAEQEREAARLVPSGDVEEALRLVQHDPAYASPDRAAFLAEMQRVQAQALAAIDGSTGGTIEFEVPEALRTLEIRLAPPGSPPGAYYMPPSEDLSRPGAIVYGEPEERAVPLFDQISTAFHEGFPGHHLQVGLQVAMADRLSRLHRVAYGYSGFAEGWALYAEQRMDELGHYQSAAARLGYLCNQMARACRVVVDIGLHLGLQIPRDAPLHAGQPWNFDRAVELMVRFAGMEAEHADSEVTRYLGWPGQAISYAVGQREILRLREQWRAQRRAAGKDEDLAGFHRRVLACGNVALDTLPRWVL
ncbi:MAG: DUF885 domain-containing protein [Deltaproteobacteria bacterium]|nr:DUF885 domain-containing protein [Deltaproteobacteria bacterium]